MLFIVEFNGKELEQVSAHKYMGRWLTEAPFAKALFYSSFNIFLWFSIFAESYYIIALAKGAFWKLKELLKDVNITTRKNL